MRLNNVCRAYTLRIALVTMFVLLLLCNGASALTPSSGVSKDTIIVSGAATATLTVNAHGGADYTKIQDAIDNASDGDTIIVSGGTTSTLTYHENVNVNKRLALRGMDNGAGQPVVDAGGNGSAITLSADWISLEGFKAVNSGYLYPDAGVRIISNNNFIKNNSASENALGIIIDTNSSSNDVRGNLFNYNTNGGLYLHINSRNNTITGNSVNSNNGYGIYLYSSSNNVIYDNYFNNVNNMASSNSINIWNIGKTPGRNIIGGQYIAGNYWGKPDGTGFSETCNDQDVDGICDIPYVISDNNTDYLPLTFVFYVDLPPTSNAGPDRFAYAGDTVIFNGNGSTDDKGIVLYEWDFTSDGVYDATGITASHIYTAAENYTATLRVTDTINQTDTDMATVVVKEPVYGGVISSLITDKLKYLRGQTVYTTAAVRNTGNKDLNAQVRFTYQKPDLSIAYTETKPVFVQIGGSVDALSSYTIPTKGSTQGTWTVKAELIYGSQILDVKTVTFQGVNKL